MDCARARAILWSDRPRLVGGSVLEATRHVEACPACERALAYDAALAAAFSDAREAEVPVRVRERARWTLARASALSLSAPPLKPPRRAGAWVVGTLVGVSVLAFLGLSSALLSRARTQVSGPSSAVAGQTQALIQDYIRRAVREQHVATSDAAVVRAFLARELGILVGVIQLSDFVIDGAEVCLLGNRRGAMVVYRRESAALPDAGQVLSYYVFPRDAGEPAPPRVVASVSAGPGTSVVTWATSDAEYALVGPFETEQLLEAARATISER